MQNSTPDTWNDIPTFVAVFSEKVKIRDSNSRVVLVGGSAFEFHFPKAHASLDADLSVKVSVSKRNELVSTVLEEMGFFAKGRVYANPKIPFTVDIVSSEVEVGELNMDDEIIEVVSTNGLSFKVLSAEAMILDRLTAWVHWKDAQSLEKVELAAKTNRKIVDRQKLKKFLKSDSVLMDKLKLEIPEKWELHKLIFD